MSLVTQGDLVIQDLEGLMEEKGSLELKVISDCMSCDLIIRHKDLFDVF